MRFCSGWGHSLKKKSGCWPVAWETICWVWGFIAVHGTLRQRVMAVSPSYMARDIVRAASDLCGLWGRERGAMWLGTRTPSIRHVGSRLPSAPQPLCEQRVTHCCSNTALSFAGSCGPGCNFSAWSQLSHSCQALCCQKTSPGTDSSKRSIYFQLPSKCDFSLGLWLCLFRGLDSSHDHDKGDHVYLPVCFSN